MCCVNSSSVGRVNRNTRTSGVTTFYCFSFGSSFLNDLLRAFKTLYVLLSTGCLGSGLALYKKTVARYNMVLLTVLTTGDHSCSRQLCLSHRILIAILTSSLIFLGIVNLSM